jgi:hypothetical protein
MEVEYTVFVRNINQNPDLAPNNPQEAVMITNHFPAYNYIWGLTQVFLFSIGIMIQLWYPGMIRNSAWYLFGTDNYKSWWYY